MPLCVYTYDPMITVVCMCVIVGGGGGGGGEGKMLVPSKEKVEKHIEETYTETKTNTM